MARPSTGPFASDRVPSSPQAIRAAEARADQVGGCACPKQQAEEELSYAAQAIDKTAGSLRLAEIEEGPLPLLALRAAAAGSIALRRPGAPPSVPATELALAAPASRAVRADGLVFAPPRVRRGALGSMGPPFSVGFGACLWLFGVSRWPTGRNVVVLS